MDINCPALHHQLGCSWEVASGACQCVTVCLQALSFPFCCDMAQGANPTLWAQQAAKKCWEAALLIYNPLRVKHRHIPAIKQAGFLSPIQAGTISAGN